jgi:CheY-like chemotaxis protein
MDGVRLARILTAHKPRIKVIFCSGGRDKTVPRILAASPGYGFLPKPFPIKQLRKILTAMLAG